MIVQNSTHSLLPIAGLPSVNSRFHPEVSAGFRGHKWLSISGGQHHTVALDAEGKVYCLGRKEYGRLGMGEINQDLIVPTPIPALEAIKCIAVNAGEAVTFAVTENSNRILLFRFIEKQALKKLHFFYRNCLFVGYVGQLSAWTRDRRSRRSGTKGHRRATKNGSCIFFRRSTHSPLSHRKIRLLPMMAHLLLNKNNLLVLKFCERPYQLTNGHVLWFFLMFNPTIL